jgi:acyl-ACP thioesterase
MTVPVSLDDFFCSCLNFKFFKKSDFIVRKAILFRHLQHESQRQSFFIDSATYICNSDKVQSALKPL